MKPQNESLAELTELVITLLSRRIADPVNVDELDESCRDLALKLNLLTEYLSEATTLSDRLASGKVGIIQTHRGNPFVAPLKTIQSNLANLIWTAKCVVEGDDDQQVNYMSDLSNAFNSMIQHQKRQKEALALAATQDYQTGVSNRLAFQQCGEALYNAGKRFILCVVDLDRLKYCNDTYGHAEGDRYIQSVCDLLGRAFNEEGRLFRIGGDEFALITLSQEADSLLERMEEARNAYISALDEHFAKERSFSFGITTVDPATGRSFESFYTEADALMYTDKASHRHN